ncbi:S41 family peptidase [Kordiimonas gwangyangensis]|uniref:S41 family peptidase n=1 Tax=Kordiimonas gwangyangensis TaxID=288022 RepID=UPI000378CB3B|nr:S41 family peptidase [Kordiimonas gwangyangensis]
MKKTLTTAIVASLMAGVSTTAFAEASSEWYGEAAISPDAKSIVFTYKGDLYKVSAQGGTAVPLTVNAAWEGHPVWSHDGKQIAFASDRNGNLDVYVMSANGGEAKRLTYMSSNDVPADFTADDKAVTFSSTRMDSAESSLFPRGSLSELYNVRVTGGTPEMVLTTPAEQAKWNDKGDKLVYREEKALESDLRKHDTSAFAHDVWMYDKKSGKHTQLTTWEGGDQNPVWGREGTVFYLSDKGDSTFNVWQLDPKDGRNEQLTSFKKHPVRSLTRAENGTLAFINHGSIYLGKGKDRVSKVDIKIAADGHGRTDEVINVSSDVSEFAVSPSGKEIAFVARGEVFVTSTEFKTTKRITDTPAQERSVDFAPDGKKIVFAAERDGKWRLVEASLENEDEKYFFAGTTINEKVIYDGDREAFQPKYSPDGKKVAFLANRDTLKVLTLESGEVTEVLGDAYNYSYADGDIHFDWSPDSKWLTVDFIARKRVFITNIAIVPADGSAPPRDISLSGYQDGVPKWHSKGAVLWASSRFGMRDHGSWGTQFDAMAAFLNQDAFDRFSMSKEEYELMKELEEDKKKEEEKAKKDEAKKDDADKGEKKDDKKEEDKVAPIKIEWDGLEDRTVRLTAHSSDIADMVLTKDADKLYYLSRFEGGYDLWMQDFREGSTKLLLKLDARNAGMELSEDEKSAFVLADGRISKLSLNGDSATRKPVSLNASMVLDGDAERAYFFEHIWRQVKEKFYNPNMHGTDWDGLKAEYAEKLPSIGNNRDFARMMEEMLGELNASHTGAYYRGHVDGADETAALGLIFDLKDTSGALTITEVLDRSPLEKADSKVKAGMKLVAVDGTTLGENVNLASLLNHKAGERVRITVMDTDGKTFDEVIKPISRREEAELLYDRWVKSRRAYVEEISGGKVGYVHVRGMNDASYRVVYSDLLGRNFDKDAVIVDTRWNGGGWLHNDLAKLLSGKQYLQMKVRGDRVYAGDPLDQWSKPSVVVMGEGNYSDAHAFPYTYKTLGIGELVGMPVPGTMTAVWWETLHSGDVTFGIPQVGQIDANGNYLENQQLEPDYKVKNLPEDSAEGRDPQLEKAVEVMLKAAKAE